VQEERRRRGGRRRRTITHLVASRSAFSLSHGKFAEMSCGDPSAAERERE
jgi:hypothetical protein